MISFSAFALVALIDGNHYTLDHGLTLDDCTRRKGEVTEARLSPTMTAPIDATIPVWCEQNQAPVSPKVSSDPRAYRGPETATDLTRDDYDAPADPELLLFLQKRRERADRQWKREQRERERDNKSSRRDGHKGE